MIKMRAKLAVASVQKASTCETVTFRAVNANAYPDDGSDENNTYARFTPTADASFVITNPALHDTFEVGQKFCVDFTKAD